MSVNSQKRNMQAIYRLASKDFSYISGERESGPNGEKKEFLYKSASFLRVLGKDLEFNEMKVTKNAGGIAVSGEVTLMGMWGDDNGLYLQLSQSLHGNLEIMSRGIKYMKDYSGGQNQWLPHGFFEEGMYEKFVNILLIHKIEQGEVRKIA